MKAVIVFLNCHFAFCSQLCATLFDSRSVKKFECGKCGKKQFLFQLILILLCAGTLTQNEMVFKRLHLGTVSYGTDTMDEIQSHIIQSYAQVTHLTFNIHIHKRQQIELDIHLHFFKLLLNVFECKFILTIFVQ